MVNKFISQSGYDNPYGSSTNYKWKSKGFLSTGEQFNYPTKTLWYKNKKYIQTYINITDLMYCYKHFIYIYWNIRKILKVERKYSVFLPVDVLLIQRHRSYDIFQTKVITFIIYLRIYTLGFIIKVGIKHLNMY